MRVDPSPLPFLAAALLVVPLPAGAQEDLRAPDPYLYGEVRLTGGDLRIDLEEAAYVAAFDVRSDGRVRLLYPISHRGGLLAAERHTVRSRLGFVAPAAAGGAAPVGAPTPTERSALAPEEFGYLLVVATDRPLELFGLGAEADADFSLAPPAGPGDHLTAERREELFVGVLQVVAPAHRDFRWGIGWIPYSIGRGLELAAAPVGPWFEETTATAEAGGGAAYAEAGGVEVTGADGPYGGADDLRYVDAFHPATTVVFLPVFGFGFGLRDPFFCGPRFGRHGFGGHHRFGGFPSHRHGFSRCGSFGFGHFPTPFFDGVGCPVGIVFGGFPDCAFGFRRGCFGAGEGLPFFHGLAGCAAFRHRFAHGYNPRAGRHDRHRRRHHHPWQRDGYRRGDRGWDDRGDDGWRRSLPDSRERGAPDAPTPFDGPTSPGVRRPVTPLPRPTGGALADRPERPERESGGRTGVIRRAFDPDPDAGARPASPGGGGAPAATRPFDGERAEPIPVTPIRFEGARARPASPPAGAAAERAEDDVGKRTAAGSVPFQWTVREPRGERVEPIEKRIEAARSLPARARPTRVRTDRSGGAGPRPVAFQTAPRRDEVGDARPAASAAPVRAIRPASSRGVRGGGDRPVRSGGGAGSRGAARGR